MSNPHTSAMPMDPYEWRESVLSTRSLSYLSTVDALGSPGLGPHSRNASYSFMRNAVTRRNTMTSADGSAYGDELEMARTSKKDGGLNDIPELPESVAESALFTLPREIRDRIYGFCLQAEGGLTVEWPAVPGVQVHYNMQPQLLRLCWIVYEEAAPLLYSVNSLTFHHPSDANMLVRALSSPTHSRYITTISLHLKAQDTRLWMPYLTSTDGARSLKADFSNLRELNIRFRSNKWNHALSPDENITLCSKDSRLNEIVDGLRHIFLPAKRAPSPSGLATKPLNEMTEQDFMAFVDRHRPGEDMAFKRQLLELHKAHVPAAAAQQTPPPTIRVVCACRVHSAHFNQVTHQDPTPVVPPIPPHALGPQAAPPQSAPVQEGQPFVGFTAVDFKAMGVKNLHDPDLGSAKVARTPFADLKGILIALEIHSLDPKRGEGSRHAITT